MFLGVLEKRLDLARLYTLKASVGVGKRVDLTRVYAIEAGGGVEEEGESDECVLSGD